VVWPTAQASRVAAVSEGEITTGTPLRRKAHRRREGSARGHSFVVLLSSRTIFASAALNTMPFGPSRCLELADDRTDSVECGRVGRIERTRRRQ
jgi:hypothetical protein